MDDSKYTKTRQKYVSFLVGLVVVIVGVILVFFYVIGISKVDGESMLPTLNNNETLVFYRLEKSYDRGEIVAINMPNGDYYVKRVIGIAGDEVDIKEGRVFVNGTALNEPYIQGVTNKTSEYVSFPLVVEEGKVFVLGDNRENSTDSRSLGTVSFYAIPGKIIGKD